MKLGDMSAALAAATDQMGMTTQRPVPEPARRRKSKGVSIGQRKQAEAHMREPSVTVTGRVECEQIRLGTVLWFNPEKRYGKILIDGSDKEAFFLLHKICEADRKKAIVSQEDAPRLATRLTFTVCRGRGSGFAAKSISHVN